MSENKTQFETVWYGAFEKCYMGCGDCDIYAETKTEYQNGNVVGVKVFVCCGNEEQCEHLMEHLKGGLK